VIITVNVDHGDRRNNGGCSRSECFGYGAVL
jgi:hypothetical protein